MQEVEFIGPFHGFNGIGINNQHYDVRCHGQMDMGDLQSMQLKLERLRAGCLLTVLFLAAEV